MRRLIVVAIACLALLGCASGGRLSGAQKLELYRAHAGLPQNDMRFFGSLNGWTDLGDSALAVWTRPSEAYLLELAGPCPDLSSALAIGLTSRAGSVSARFDKVLVQAPTPGLRMPCFIHSIRRLDVKALRASEQALRQAQVRERDEG